MELLDDVIGDRVSASSTSRREALDDAHRSAAPDQHARAEGFDVEQLYDDVEGNAAGLRVGVWQAWHCGVRVPNAVVAPDWLVC